MSSILIAPAPQPSPDRENVISRLSSWVGQGRRPPQNPAQPSSGPALADETLDQIGAENEEIKNRCIDFVRKIDELSALKENFVEISNWIGQILSVREQTNAALVERAMMIALAEGALADLKAESRALYDAKEEVTAENALLRAENERLKSSVRSREARIETVEADLHAANDAAAELRQSLEAERAHGFHVKSEFEAAQTLLEKNDSLISQLQVDLAAARDQLVFARQDNEMLQENLNEAQENVAKLQTQSSEAQVYSSGLADNIRELDIALESERRQVAKLDALLASNQAEHVKAQSRWREEKDEDRRMIAELEAKVDKLTTHVQAGDKLLVGVRAELQAKADECRAAERRSQEIEQKFSRLTEHAENVSLDAAQLKQDLDAREQAFTRLNTRAKSLIRSMRDMSALLEKAEQKAQLTTERLAAETKRFDEQKSRLEQTVRDLTEQLEKERLSKMVTAGALEAARQQRLQPREEVKLADILARAEEAHNAAEASAAAAADPTTPRR